MAVKKYSELSWHRKKMRIAQDERAKNRKRLIKIKRHMKPVMEHIKPIMKIIEQIKDEKVVTKKI